MAARPTALFRHYGISLAETEIIYDTLGREFEVDVEAIEPDDPNYLTMVEIQFPLPYGESFFQTFTMQSWFKIKNMIKDMKHRRGKKGVRAYIRFSGALEINSVVTFPILSKSDRAFEMAFEKIEYLVDVVPVQLQKLPPETKEVLYSYDENAYRWSPSMAKAKHSNYVYKNNEWKSK